MPSADEAAELLVSSLLAELPEGIAGARGERAAVILNGLGSVKYEELFVVYRRVAQLLAEAGVEAVEPDVGELVTSFDMAGISLTLSWLDEELETLWTAGADTPAYRKGAVVGSQAPYVAADPVRPDETGDAVVAATEESRTAAVTAVAALKAIKDTVDAHADELGRIDAVAGDGDHGIGMRRGSDAAHAAALAAAEAGAGAGTTLAAAADAWSDKAGGTSGALWGVLLHAVGAALGDTERPTAEAVAHGVTEASAAVRRLGKAEVGDKTMVDVLVPFADVLAEATAPSPADGDSGLVPAWDRAATAAERAAEATAGLVPRIGRARPHAERSLGTPDAGAHSLALIVRAVHGALTTR